MKLTGNARLRSGTETSWSTLSGRNTRKVLVLQVEYFNWDFASSPSTTLWRDAYTEDLTEVERLNPGFISNFSKGST